MAQADSFTTAPPEGGKSITLGEVTMIVVSLVGAIGAGYIAANAYTAPYAFHMVLFALAGFGGAVATIKRYKNRPAVIPQEINGKPNYNYGVVKFTSIAAVFWGIAGFLVGLIEDTLTPARFGAAALAHTVVGYLAAWGRAVFFADNILVNAGFVAVGLWLRDVIVLVASGTDHRQLIVELTFYSPIQALTTAAFALAVLLTFRALFSVRLDA